MRFTPLILLTIAAIAVPLHAAEPKPEIERPLGTPQADGVAHTLRTIPEACARLEGKFTGQAAQPYALSAARSSERCQPRARLIDALKAKASAKNGWILNDVIRVPRSNCPQQQAVVQVWRKPGSSAPPKLDAQGRSRIYLRDANGAPVHVDVEALPVYAAEMQLVGKPCR